MFAVAGRAAFRDGSRADDATWARAMGWALSVAVIALPCYLRTNATLVAMSRRVIAAIPEEEAGR